MRPCNFPVERHARRRQKGHNRGQNTSTRETVVPTVLADTSQERLDCSAPTDAAHDLTDTMLTAIVSHGNDAMNLLFEAAQREESEISPVSPVMVKDSNSLPELSMELLDIWNAYRFVRMGWFSAVEAVWLVEMFFKNMAPLSSVLDSFYATHANHYLLVTREPMLLCMILTISSRYHALPTNGGCARGYLIHQRLWDHCLHLLMRLVLGSEKYSKAKTRTLGMVEALLLLTEWLPRAIYAPPPSDGWDSDVLYTMQDRRDQEEIRIDNPSRTRWREDVIEPTNRADRMNWMVLSCALSLGNELGLFDEDDSNEGMVADRSQYELRTSQRKIWLAKLLYIYQEQLASRLGRRSMMPSGVSHAAICTKGARSLQEGASDRTPFITAWTRLTKITRSVSDLLFPTASTTSQLLRSGRYLSMTEHIETLLSVWRKDHEESLFSGSHLADLLAMEYESTRMYTYSLGLQAIASRTLAESTTSPSQTSVFQLASIDYSHVQNIISSALTTLRIATKLFNGNHLRFCPLKTFLHITTASIFLLKGLGIGVSPPKLRNSLAVLDRVIVALKNSNPDDLHIGGRYATLLEMHVVKLQEHFIPSFRSHDITPPEPERTQAVGRASDSTEPQPDLLDFRSLDENELGDTDWLSLPPDTNLFAFGMENFQGLQCLGDDTLDFLWNLGA
ncbi:hypothetical protein K491DRAFT_634608 [Lophiostoma macrostomum CBS 122681]|uniref:Transcription factor domain-containing protein n=1 Tax=Lophiostoma macrostomum CBS 122681 TaxID=1314788 RepID=A0A6A6SYV4_9PLEO|nr:hypothetical protein K491DRAFT_634608 [Lophiostoma macrostomum CBS 122681]